ncbi:TPA: fibronectin-binding SSURE repeat-containing protein [Streptococcus agalactiae]|nr:fibronectin-binding SSURE repeat-containing protein [Streptococcus agalactiae]
MKISQYNKWSIRRLKVGAASVMIASGSIVALGQSHIVSADEMSQPKTTITAPTANTSTNVESSTDKALSKVTTMETSSEMPKMQNMAKVEKTSDKPMMVATSVRKMMATPTPVAMTKTTSVDEVKKSTDTAFKQTVDVPAHYVNAAKGNGPFLAGVNQTIPYEAFGGDGMLTRLILKASEGAKWSDNGVDKNSPLLPLKGLTKGKYFYQVSLNGNTTGKEGQALLDQIKANDKHSYQATIRVYGAKDGKVDLKNMISQKMVTINIPHITTDMEVKNSLLKMAFKEKVDVPAKYVSAAKAKGPFLAGVNETIPYEAFGGDGMLTRLILKASEGAKWSDNGVDKNSPLLPLKDLTKGKYFYQVSLNGNTAGKKGQALLDQIKANGSHTYQATITIYGTKDGKVDMNTILGQKTVMIHINVAKKDMNSTSMMMKKDKMTMPMKKEMTSSKINTGMMMSNNKMSANMQMSSQAKSNDKAGKKMSMMSKNLPNTGETKQQNVGVLGMLSLAFATGLTALGLKKSKQR